MKKLVRYTGLVGYTFLIAVFIGLALVLYGNPAHAADNLEPGIPHPEQEKEAARKLSALEKRFVKKPNILIFLIDDMGWGDPGVYGGGHAVGAPTPNMDRLAQEGLMLTSCYAQPTCSPTRATLMTGRLPIRHGLWRPTMYGEHGGVADEITAADILSENGYVTQLVGKWHCGESIDSQPQNKGYDDFYGFLTVSDMYTEWRDEHYNPEVVFDKERTELIRKTSYCLDLVHAKKGQEIERLKEITIPVMANLDQDFADYSEKFIRRMAQSEKPFYLIHAPSKVHFYNYPADGYKGISPAKHPYKDAVIEVDDILGRLIQVLEETGQIENTLVLVTSDNGPEEDTWPDSGHTPFRGAKGSTWEGGTRVPGIVYWPGVIKPGRISDGLFDLADLFNTSLALAGLQDKLPEDRYIDGIDQTSFLLADNGESNRKCIFFTYVDKLSAIRMDEYKSYNYIIDSGYGGYQTMGSMNDGRLASPTLGLLFNLYMDPKERSPILIRKVWFAGMLEQEYLRFQETFKKYPPKELQLPTFK